MYIINIDNRSNRTFDIKHVLLNLTTKIFFNIFSLYLMCTQIKAAVFKVVSVSSFYDKLHKL